MDDAYIYIIIALLPLSALMVVVQKNPYHALVIRGILGAVAALVYAVLGAADVALTEALVGTMLAITLYAVAVRSSLNMRLGILQQDLATLEASVAQPVAQPLEAKPQAQANFNAPSESRDLAALMGHLRAMLKKRHMRLELVSYPDSAAMEAGLRDRDIHALCVASAEVAPKADYDEFPSFVISTRIRRLYDLMQAELPILSASLAYTNPAEQRGSHLQASEPTVSAIEEVHS